MICFLNFQGSKSWWPYQRVHENLLGGFHHSHGWLRSYSKLRIITSPGNQWVLLKINSFLLIYFVFLSFWIGLVKPWPFSRFTYIHHFYHGPLSLLIWKWRALGSPGSYAAHVIRIDSSSPFQSFIFTWNLIIWSCQCRVYHVYIHKSSRLVNLAMEQQLLSHSLEGSSLLVISMAPSG